MMISKSEFEQSEQLKLFWQKHGKTISTAIFLIFIGAMTWQLWQRYQTNQAQQASVLYDQLVAFDSHHKAQEAKTVAENITKSFRFTIYATMAKLWLAEQAVSEQKYDEATAYLKSAQKSESDKRVKQIIVLRLARVYMQQKDYTNALIILDRPIEKSFAHVVYELKGDTYRMKNDLPRAQKAYQEALNTLPSQDPEKIRIEMKLNSLGIL